jgi:hypothetical protein
MASRVFEKKQRAGGREHDVHDVGIREAEVAQALEVGVRDRGGIVDDALPSRRG